MEVPVLAERVATKHPARTVRFVFVTNEEPAEHQLISSTSRCCARTVEPPHTSSTSRSGHRAFASTRRASLGHR